MTNLMAGLPGPELDTAVNQEARGQWSGMYAKAIQAQRRRVFKMLLRPCLSCLLAPNTSPSHKHALLPTLSLLLLRSRLETSVVTSNTPCCPLSCSPP